MSEKRYLSQQNGLKLVLLFLLVSFFTVNRLQGQNMKFGVFADPAVGWFSSDTRDTKNDGARAGFNFGLTFNRYFGENYSVSTGISLMSSGGRLSSTDTTELVFTNFNTLVLPGDPMIYRIQYLNIPLGLKFESNQIGYIKFFTDLGLDFKAKVGGKIDVPSEDIEKEAAGDELKPFNLGYHVMAGIQYSIGGTTEFVFGLGFENNFLDVTKELNDQIEDRIRQNILKFRFGINF